MKRYKENLCKCGNAKCAVSHTKHSTGGRNEPCSMSMFRRHRAHQRWQGRSVLGRMPHLPAERRTVRPLPTLERSGSRRHPLRSTLSPRRAFQRRTKRREEWKTQKVKCASTSCSALLVRSAEQQRSSKQPTACSITTNAIGGSTSARNVISVVVLSSLSRIKRTLHDTFRVIHVQGLSALLPLRVYRAYIQAWRQDIPCLRLSELPVSHGGACI